MRKRNNECIGRREVLALLGAGALLARPAMAQGSLQFGSLDHIEFFGPPEAPDAHSRNFVYCPGGAYDRSPCGTGTSAKLACLAADGKLQPGDSWIQESIIGSRFDASYMIAGAGQIISTITGTAYLCSEGTLIQQPDDPFKNGIGRST